MRPLQENVWKKLATCQLFCVFSTSLHVPVKVTRTNTTPLLLLDLFPTTPTTVNSKRSKTRSGTAARALWLSAAPRQRACWATTRRKTDTPLLPAASGGAADNQSARTAVPPLVYVRSEFTVLDTTKACTFLTSTCVFLVFQDSLPLGEIFFREQNPGGRSEQKEICATLAKESGEN
ncbi:hypothetical protein Y032_0045g1169 [Ancylostoma ceylanicum]|uniref:Uncharacterized protein n=1 Tax=Ancylostoma ceylanicum TaxID=53326 RepID=A0A016UDK7_9BILA|nr:hypothetical protein Y032_0045g1169 [Ancylostoma ceylanicum]